MPDAEIMKEIESVRAQRAERILRAFVDGVDSDHNDAVQLGAAFQAAADALREESDLLTKSKLKGWQSTSKQLNQVAARLVGLGQDVSALATVDIDAIVQDKPKPTITEDFRKQTAAYLHGDTDRLPSLSDDAVAAILHGDGIDMLPPVPGDVDGTTAAFFGTTIEEQPAMTNPFSDPEPYASATTNFAPFPGAEQHRVSFVDLLKPAPNGTAPEHWSFSQLSTLEDCGLKYRLQRIANVPQTPQWSTVGGSAFHAATEDFDRHLTDTVPVNFAEPVEVVATNAWKAAFGAEIQRVFTESGIPPGADGTAWRASNGGKEGYTWWLVEGPRMLQTYMTTRAALIAAGVKAKTPRLPLVLPGTGVSVIEWPYERKIDGPLGQLTIKGIVDRAYRCHDDSILIVDLKTGRGDVDRAQLGEYAWALYLAGFTNQKILGSVYDARRGLFDEPLNLLNTYPWDEFVYRYHSAEAQRRSGIYLPRRSSFCVACSVRYACPVGSR